MKIDRDYISKDKYSKVAKNGSVQIRINYQCFGKLSTGRHILKVEFKDGSAETFFRVAAAGAKDGGKDDDNIAKNGTGKSRGVENGTGKSRGVKTGDENHLAIWIILMAAALTGTIGMVFARKRK